MDNKKLKEIMKAQGYTIEMLSLISKIPVGTLSKIISGITSNPGYETMSAIAKALHCSLDEFSGRPVLIPYDYEEYLRRFKLLPTCQKEYIKYVIDLEYDRMIHLQNDKKISLRCYEFTNIVDGWAELDSAKTHNVTVDKNLLTDSCTFLVWLRTDLLEPKFFKNSVLGFQRNEGQRPKSGEIWIVLHNGLLFIGRFYKSHERFILKSLNGTIDDISATDYSQYRRLGLYAGCVDVPELTNEKTAFGQD
ncbi:XRE family transcriptional regulator [Blautia pseudococcoides]|uniref:XRE family transcriptional regulator n=1 Tax=Blautia pseudococcoides TaxID=1796616 RepID=UPI00148AFA07|nr:XRE family transcriptional regulator [Blautia pseudococcoides]QJU14382.1 XRE family transcriptional regulator [Blautia pseudococcoides]